MKIGVWGNYNYGNFGDDLMAISIASHLKEEGHEPLVYRLDPQLSQQHNIQTTNSISTFVSESDLLLIGGGGMLVGSSKLKQIFSPVARKFENDFKELNKALSFYRKNIVAVSIGGDGIEYTELPAQRRRLFSSTQFRGGTVRLKGDLPLTKKFGKKFAYIPDILFDTPNHFRVHPHQKKQTETWIGLNLIAKDLNGETWHEKLIEEAAKNPNLRLFFIKTHLPDYSVNYEYLPKTLPPNVTVYQYNKMEDMLNLLASLDMVISSKLHVGLTALALGTPFFSFKGRGKTLAQLKELDGERAILSEINLEEFTANYFDRKAANLKKLYNEEKLRFLMEESKKHYHFIDRFVEEHKNQEILNHA